MIKNNKFSFFPFSSVIFGFINISTYQFLRSGRSFHLSNFPFHMLHFFVLISLLACPSLSIVIYSFHIFVKVGVGRMWRHCENGYWRWECSSGIFGTFFSSFSCLLLFPHRSVKSRDLGVWDEEELSISSSCKNCSLT